jgi:hypothetical protein
VENENAENVRGSQDRMQRFNHQMRFVVEGLRKTESMVLPACVSHDINSTSLAQYVAGSMFPLGSKTMSVMLKSKRLARCQV